jgi:hypothetical protein
MSKFARLASITLAVVLALSACNLPSSAPATEDPNVVFTAAAQTVAAQITQTGPVATSTPPVAAATNTSIVPPTLPSTFTPLPPQATATQSCDKADFITDVTIPDGTVLSPGESFTKTWRVKNTGSCSWTPSYAIVFSSGDSMSGPASQALTGNVNPGDTMDISVSLKAPATTGSYRGYWKLRNAAGVLFSTVYVDIKVQTAAFAVTSVNYTLSTWSDSGHTDCPRVTANITANGAGTVTFKWGRKDSPNGGSLQSIDFASAGTKSVNYDWSRGSTWQGTDTWVGIYVDDPNHQDFGHLDFDDACTSP